MSFRIIIQDGLISSLWDFYPRWPRDFYPRWLHFNTSTIKITKTQGKNDLLEQGEDKCRLGFLSKIASFHAFGIFIQDGPISMRLGFLSKMAAFQYVNYKNDAKTYAKLTFLNMARKNAVWDFYPR